MTRFSITILYYVIAFHCIYIGISCISRAKIFNPFKCRLSIDYGPNSIGVACSDIIGGIKPRCTIPNSGNLTAISNEILDIAKRDGASEVIVGIPLDSNGKVSYQVRNFNGRLCLNFTRVLAAVANNRHGNTMMITLVDERYTTREAKQRLEQARIKGNRFSFKNVD